MRNFSIFTLLATLLFVGCSDVFVELESPLANETTLPNLTANFADDGLTRTYVEEGKYLRWHEADLITAFYGNTLNRQYKFNGATGANSGTFSLVPNGELGTGNTLDAIYAIYPYDASATISDEGLISLTLPSEQSYAENSFGKGANTMVAVTESVEDTFLSFKNACGYLKLYLYNVDGATLKSVSVKGNNNEKIAGAATATIEFGGVPTVVMGNDATTTVTLGCGEGIALGTTSETATALWIVLPETTFEKGITITVTDTEGRIFEKSTSNSVAITRNDIQPMAALAVEFVAPVVKPANNEIWYTNGSTTKATTPYKTNVFGVNIVSNTYDAEKECWVIKFDGEVTSIGDMAFYNCSSLTSVTIPDSVTTIGNCAFDYCSSLTSVNIPNGVTTIGNSAFFSCWNLTSVTIGDGVTTIGNAAFSGCSRLTSVTIPNGVTTIGECAFQYCSNLTSINIPDSVTTIGESAFRECSRLTSVTIPDSVTTIGNYAFHNCSSLTSVTIPDSVTTIGDRAFCNCSSLTSVTMGNSVTTIGDEAFLKCSSLQEFKGNLASEDGRCLIIDGVLNLFAPAGITEYTIPDGVTTIGSTTFEGCSGLTSVTIPNSVTTIGNSAFEVCSGLTSINIPDSVTTIGKSAFRECSRLTSVTIPDSVTTIGDWAFLGCKGLTSVTIPDSVTTIGEYAFYYCLSLTSVTIGNSVTTIGNNAFEDCSGLTSINIPDSVTTIGNYAFHNCSRLTSVTIGNSVTTIGDSAFEDCSSLTSVTIPDSVTSIGVCAFSDCTSLTSVYCKPTTPPTEGYSMFGYNTSGRTIYVPRNSVEAYKSAEYWSEYASAIVGYDF